MAEARERIRRLLDDELGGCCAEDVEHRLDDLDAVVRTAGIDDLEEDLQLLSALANETRYRIVRLLVAADELCVCELTPLLDVSESAVSHALSDLVNAGLVTRRKRGKWRYYRATDRAGRIVSSLDGVNGAECC